MAPMTHRPKIDFDILAVPFNDWLMRTLALVLILCFSVTVFAKDREWKEAVVLAPTSENGPAVVTSTGSVSGNTATSTAFGGFIQIVHYAFQTPDMIYVTSCVPRGTLRYKCPDVTVNGKVKVSVDGKDLHVLDDAGKDRKIPIIEKIAPKGQ